MREKFVPSRRSTGEELIRPSLALRLASSFEEKERQQSDKMVEQTFTMRYVSTDRLMKLLSQRYPQRDCYQISVSQPFFFPSQVSLINHARYGGSGNVIGHVLRKGANFGFPSQVGHVGYGKGGWQCWLTRLYPADPIGCLFLEHSCGSFPGKY